MTEFLITTSQEIPQDAILGSLEAKITDKGVEITAKFPVIGAYVSKLCSKRRMLKGIEYYDSFKDLTFYSLPAHLANEMGTAIIAPDMFLTVAGVDEYGNRRKQEPNMIWLAASGLEEGVTIVFMQPAHVPADIMEYLNRCMEKARLFYIKNIRQVSYKTTLIERN